MTDILLRNLQDIDVGFERTKMDIEARSMAKKDQMTGKVHVTYFKHIYNTLGGMVA